MAADAEVKLNFTAQVEQARAGIAEIAAAMEKLAGKGGVMSPGEASLLNQMQGQLAAYKARLDELTAAYDRLRASSGGVSRQALAQIKELQDEVARLTKTQDDLLKKIVDLQVANNELKGATAGVGGEMEKAGEGGVRVVRSLRGVIANFIRDLARGKLAVRELGVALKGLMYSTVVLGAIQLAMEGIGFIVERVRGLFEAQEEAAEKAAERVRDAADAAEKAGEAADAAQAKLERAAQQDDLRDAAGALAESYERQRAAAEGTLRAVRERFAAEAAERAYQAKEEDFKFSMRELELRARVAKGGMTQGEFARAMLALRGEQERAKIQRGVTEANAARDAGARELAGLEEDLRRATENRDRWNRYREGMVSPEEVEVMRARLKELIADQGLASERGQNGKAARLGRRIRELDAQIDGATPEVTYRNAQKNAELAEKNVETLEKRVNDAYYKLRELEQNATRTERNAGQGLRHQRAMEAANLGLTDAQDMRKRQQQEGRACEKERARREKLEGQVAEVVERARRAVEETPDDARDDRKAFEAIGNFLDKNAAAIREYGVNVKSLLDVTRQLKLLYDGAEAERKRVAAEIADLRRQVTLNQKAIRK